MTGTTPLMGWSYPSASDLIAKGAAAIEAGLKDVESTFFLSGSKYSADDPYTAWPIGHSLMYTNGASGWPYTTGQVVTIKRIATHAHQWFYTYTSNSERQRVYIRIGYTSGGSPTWSPWQVVTSTGTSEEEATGSVTVTPTPNTPTPVKVSFPSGRFSKNPRVFLQYQGQRPEDVSLSTYARTTTGFTAYVYRGGSTSVVVHWYAVVMASDAADN